MERSKPWRWLEPWFLVDAFCLVNVGFMTLDIYLAHSANQFRRPAEYIPLYFSALSPLLLLAGLAARKRWIAVWTDLGYLVGWGAILVGLTGVILPTLLGLLGACTYVYRSFDRAMRSCTLHGSEGMHGVLRMLLGAILGGLLGLIWTGGQGVRLEGVTLSLGAVAFVVGFSVEIVFRTLDAMVASVARRLSTKPSLTGARSNTSES